MINEIRQLISLFTPRRKKQFFPLFALILLGALAELVTLGAVIPFLALMTDPSKISQFPFVQSLFDEMGLNTAESMLLPCTILFSSVALCAALIRMSVVWFTNRYAFTVGLDIGERVYKNILFQPYIEHTRRNSSEIVSVIAKIHAVTAGLLLPLIQVSSAIIISATILVGLILVNAEIALVAGGSFAFIYVVATAFTRKRLASNSKLIASTQTQRIQAVQEGLGGIRDVVIDGTQHVHINKFKRLDIKYRWAQAINVFMGVAPRYLIESFGMILIATIAYSFSQQQGGLSGAIPMLGALAIGAQRLLPLFQQIYQGWANVTGNRAALKDVLELMSVPTTKDLSPSFQPTEVKFENQISFSNLSFTYSEDGTDVLNGLSFNIPKGRSLGIIGATGGGKSTLIDVLMGLLSPSNGTLKVDGTTIDSKNCRSWQNKISHVPQSIFLADASVEENIAFGVHPHRVDKERVRWAARSACIDSFVEGLDSGYQTNIGENGVLLSGGQRQRIGIARALYKGTEVLVLDEATSALDEKTEQSVMDAINELGKDLTVIIIAHRTTTLRFCDEIIQIESGVISQSGSYENVVLNSESSVR